MAFSYNIPRSKQGVDGVKGYENPLPLCPQKLGVVLKKKTYLSSND
jgi:hypothetical protein